MKWFVLSLLVMLGFCSRSQNTLTVTVSNIPNSKGQLYIGLFNEPVCFPQKDKTYKYVIVQSVKGSVSVSFDIPIGTYAVSVFHDANENGDLDTNFLGAPTEYYGFSNNARGLFSAPSFEDCQITFQGESTISINLH